MIPPFSLTSDFRILEQLLQLPHGRIDQLLAGPRLVERAAHRHFVTVLNERITRRNVADPVAGQLHDQGVWRRRPAAQLHPQLAENLARQSHHRQLPDPHCHHLDFVGLVLHPVHGQADVGKVRVRQPIDLALERVGGQLGQHRLAAALFLRADFEPLKRHLAPANRHSVARNRRSCPQGLGGSRGQHVAHALDHPEAAPLRRVAVVHVVHVAAAPVEEHRGERVAVDPGQGLGHGPRVVGRIEPVVARQDCRVEAVVHRRGDRPALALDGDARYPRIDRPPGGGHLAGVEAWGQGLPVHLRGAVVASQSTVEPQTVLPAVAGRQPGLGQLLFRLTDGLGRLDQEGLGRRAIRVEVQTEEEPWHRGGGAVRVRGVDQDVLGRHPAGGPDHLPNQGHVRPVDHAHVQREHGGLRALRALEDDRLGPQRIVNPASQIIVAEVAHQGQSRGRSEIDLGNTDAKHRRDSGG